METHGGYGGIWARCYFGVPDGVVFETDATKVEALAKQRPTWAVYEAECAPAIAAGVGSHLAVNFLDVDPYGDPWPTLGAFFGSSREFPAVLGVAVNDGLRQKLKMNGAWTTGSMAGAVQKYGNAAIFKRYVEICREMLSEMAAQRGYRLSRWAGYYCGYADQMTHYAALLVR